MDQDTKDRRERREPRGYAVIGIAFVCITIVAIAAFRRICPPCPSPAPTVAPAVNVEDFGTVIPQRIEPTPDPERN